MQLGDAAPFPDLFGNPENVVGQVVPSVPERLHRVTASEVGTPSARRDALRVMSGRYLDLGGNVRFSFDDEMIAKSLMTIMTLNKPPLAPPVFAPVGF